MKRTVCIILTLIMLVSLVGCGSSSEGKSAPGGQVKTVDDVLSERMDEDGGTTSPGASSTKPSKTAGQVDAGPVDIDLTKLSSTLVYSEVYDMMSSPENYIGKRVRMRGPFTYSKGDGRYYYACIISDATACCAQGIEFLLKDGRTSPEEYPAIDTEITVVGVFDTYYEGANQYCQLIDAVME
ncbi:MAG: hypothetical protein K5756_06290 [Clostridiales bacterium]|nr:hypothetical protein [Clostridiales bacterium]